MSTPERIGPYVVEAELGRGGQAIVYRVRHPALADPRALKVLQTRDARRVTRLMAEGRAQVSLRHPNVVAVTDWIDLDGTAGLLMDLVEGPSLADVLARGPLPLELVDEWANGIFAGVEAAHALGLVHRDLKPSNVLLEPVDDRFVPRVSDFGIAKRLGDDLGTLTGTALGSPAYMAPEQARDGKHVDERADVWSLGVMLYEMLTGALPFGGASSTSLPERRPDLPRRMVDAVAGALVDDPGARWPSVEALRVVWSGEGTDARPAARVPRWVEQGFVGRSEELASLGQQLAAQRLVTVLGLGGVGKSRVAREIARRWQGDARVVDLAASRDLDGLLQKVAAALDVSLEVRDPVAQVGRLLRGLGRCLLVLDGVATSPGVLGALERWLDASAELRLLVVAGAALGVVGEVVWPLGPLSAADAERLLVRRTVGVRLDAAHRRLVLDASEGVPLAIELAAAQLRLAPVTEVLERLRGTLRTAMDAAFDALHEEERAALTQLSVFAGRPTLAAASAVVRVDGAWTLDLLHALAERSLVEVDEDGRFLLSPTVRAYAAQRLSDGGAAAQRHIGCFSAWDAGALEEMDADPLRFSELRLDLDDVLLALDRALDAGLGPEAASAASAAWVVLFRVGALDAFLERLLRVLEAPLDDRERARMASIAVHVETLLGRGAAAEAHARQAVELARPWPASLVAASQRLGWCLVELGRPSEALPVLQEALTLAQAHGAAHLGSIHGNLALALAGVGRRDEAQDHLRIALELHRAAGRRHHQALVLGNLAAQEHHAGRLSEATRLLYEALALHRELGYRRHEGLSLTNLGYLCLLDGRGAEGEGLLREALALHRGLGFQRLEALTCAFLGKARAPHDPDEAAALMEEACHLQAEMRQTQGVAATRMDLGDLELQRGRDAAAALQFEQAEQIFAATGPRRFRVLAATARIGSLALAGERERAHEGRASLLGEELAWDDSERAGIAWMQAALAVAADPSSADVALAEAAAAAADRPAREVLPARVAVLRSRVASS